MSEMEILREKTTFAYADDIVMMDNISSGVTAINNLII